MNKKLSLLASIHYGKSPTEVLLEDGLYPIIGTGGKYGQAQKAMFQSAVVVPRKGSLGNPQLLEEPFWPVDMTFALIPQEKVDLRWLYYSLLNYDLTKLNEATGVPSISRDWLSKIVFIDPGFDQQKKIADILSNIDQTIEKTEALIHKYQQIKTGLMHDLFPRGVTADGKFRPPREQAPELYKETPIGWIPKEWDFTTCDRVCEKIIDCKNRTPPITYEGFPVIRTPNVRDGDFVDEELVFTDSLSYEIWTQRGKPQVGDIVITREAPVGEVCMIPERHSMACLGQRIMLYRPNKDLINPYYFLFVLQSQAIQNRLDLISGGSTVGHVRVGDIRELWIYKPESQEEQKKIGELLNSVTKRLDSEKSKLRKLNHLKSGLMHDLLTGKVQVSVN